MTFAFIEAQRPRAFADRRGRLVACREPVVGEVRRAAAVAAARAGRCGGAQPAARAARRAAVRDRHAVRRRPARRARSPACGPAPARRRTGRARARTVDFFDVKGVVETRSAARSGVELIGRAGRVRYFVEGRAAERSHDGGGRRASSASSRRRFSTRAGFPATKSSTRSSSTSTRLPRGNRRDDLRAESLPRFPSIVRDLSVLVDSALPAAAVRGTIRSAAPATLAHVVEFDRYAAKGCRTDESACRSA